jgi:hypothetical protein
MTSPMLVTTPPAPPRPRFHRRLGAIGLGVLLLGAGGLAACGSADDAATSDDATAVPATGPDGATNADGGSATQADSARDDATPTVDGGGDADPSDANPSDGDATDATDADDDAGEAGPLLDAGADAATNDDPFDTASCGGAVLTGAQASAMLGAASQTKLADATLRRRSRACAGATIDTCGPWGAQVVHTQSLLTYSGGVVTDYKTFSFPTHLVLSSAAGTPKLSIRHTSDYKHSPGSSTRGVVFSFGADPMINTYPIIYVWDFAPAPNRYEDLQGRLGATGELHAREHCARVVFPSGITTEVAALYRY